MEGHRVHVVHLLRPDLLQALSSGASKQSASGEFAAVAASRAFAELKTASEWCEQQQLLLSAPVELEICPSLLLLLLLSGA